MARNDMPQCCMAFCTIVSLCLGKKQPAAAFHGMSHHAALLFFIPWPSAAACFFVPLQETMCHSILHHHSLFCGKKQCAAAFHDIACHGASCRGIICCAMAARIKNNQPVWCWPPWWCSGSCFGLVGCCVFCRGFCFFVFKGGINLFGFGGLGGMAVIVVGGILGFAFFAVAICIPLWHSAELFLCHSAVLCAAVLHFVLLHSILCHGAIFVPWHHALCHGSVIGATALCFVPWPSTMGCGIVPYVAFCAMAFCFMLWHCATALAMCHKCCFLCLSIVLCARVLFLCHGIVQCAATWCNVAGAALHGMLQHCPCQSPFLVRQYCYFCHQHAFLVP